VHGPRYPMRMRAGNPVRVDITAFPLHGGDGGTGVTTFAVVR
jgi:hypothetical protein